MLSCPKRRNYSKIIASLLSLCYQLLSFEWHDSTVENLPNVWETLPNASTSCRIDGVLFSRALRFQNANRIENCRRRAGRDEMERPKNGELKLPT